MTEADDRYEDALRRFAGDLRMARQVFASMRQREVAITARHWQLYLQAHLDGRDLDGAREVIEQMGAAGVDTPTKVRWQLALVAARDGREADAVDQIEQLRAQGVDPGPEHAPQALTILVRTGAFATARGLLRSMAQNGQAAGESEYAGLLDDCLRRRALNDTEAIIELMGRVGRAPTAEQAGALVAMFARAGHPDRAEKLAGGLEASGVTLPAGTHAQVAIAYARSGDAEAARAALSRSQDQSASGFVLNELLAAWIAAGDRARAWELAVELHEAGRIPTGANLEGLASLGGADDAGLAAGALDWMVMLGAPVPSAVAAEVVPALIADGRLVHALELVEGMLASGSAVDRRVARRVIDALVRGRRLDEATTMLDRLRAAGTRVHGRDVTTLVMALIGAKRVDEAVNLCTTLIADGVKPTVADASRIVAGIVRGGALAQASTVIDQLVERGVVVDEPTFRELLWAYAKRGEHEPARAVHERMVAAGITPDERHAKALEWASGATRRRLDDTDEDAGGQTMIDIEAAGVDSVVSDSEGGDDAPPAQAAPPQAQTEGSG